MEGDFHHVTTAIMDLTTLMRSHNQAGEMKRKRREEKRSSTLILFVRPFFLFSSRLSLLLLDFRYIMNVVIYFYYPSSSSETRDVLAFLGLRKSQAQNPPRSFVYLYICVMCYVLCMYMLAIMQFIVQL